MSDSREVDRPITAARANMEASDTATSGSETTATTRIEVKRNFSRDEQNDVTDKTKRQHMSEPENDAIAAENERNDYTSNKVENASSRPHLRNGDVRSPAASWQGTGCVRIKTTILIKMTKLWCC